MKNYEFYAHKLDPNNITWASCYKKDEHYTQLGPTFAYTLKGRDIVNLHQEMNTALSKDRDVYIIEKISEILQELNMPQQV